MKEFELRLQTQPPKRTFTMRTFPPPADRSFRKPGPTALPILATLTLIALMLGPPRVTAQGFDCGSTGAYGALNVTNDMTLDMPADGVFNCTTINVDAGKTLRFKRNPLNTPVYLLATGDVTINGTIDLSGNNYSGSSPGTGGPGGFDGGYGGLSISGYSTPGDGHGPGKGTAQYAPAAFAQIYGNNTNVYGNSWLSPLIGGSGGAGSAGNPGLGGGGGGGAILIASNSKISVVGAVICNGGYGAGSGSGGAIRLVAPIVTGSGSLTAAGGPWGAGTGRIRVDCPDDYSFRQLVMSGVSSRGSRMIVFPAVLPRLDIIEAAGQTIAEGTPAEVVVQLPAGASTNQTVTVQARNFTSDVPISVVVTPENAASTNYDATISLGSGDPPKVTVNIAIPPGMKSHIHAWTR